MEKKTTKKELTFASLVRKIDEKWSHTYEDYEEKEEDQVLEAAKKTGWVEGWYK
jgi:hypothetical protein